MNRALASILCAVLLAGCSAPRLAGSPADREAVLELVQRTFDSLQAQDGAVWTTANCSNACGTRSS